MVNSEPVEARLILKIPITFRVPTNSHFECFSDPMYRALLAGYFARVFQLQNVFKDEIPTPYIDEVVIKYGDSSSQSSS